MTAHVEGHHLRLPHPEVAEAIRPVCDGGVEPDVSGELRGEVPPDARLRHRVAEGVTGGAERQRDNRAALTQHEPQQVQWKLRHGRLPLKVRWMDDTAWTTAENPEDASKMMKKRRR